MKTAAILLVAAALLSGCATKVIVQKEIVTVDKPVPFIPVPPVVPRCELMVDKLVPEDKETPGKVGQAYKYDTMCLRMRSQIQDQILEQYTKSSVNFDEINKQISELFTQINNKEAAVVEKASTGR